MPGPNNQPSYCIDQTEVTNAQYQAFWQGSSGLVSQQIAECSWNPDFTPTSTWPVGASLLQYPVRGVNWCEAYMYCFSEGKQLCGAIAGGAVPFNSYDDHLVSQWDNACTSVNVNIFPYPGMTYMPALCNGAGNGTPTWQVRNAQGNAPSNDNGGCLGGAPGLYDMSGNVREWTDSCDGTTGAADNCRLRGGSYNSNGVPAALQCDAADSDTRSAAPLDVGFRCCSG